MEKAILIGLLIFAIVGFGFSALMGAKNENTYEKRCIIIHKIGNYDRAVINKPDFKIEDLIDMSSVMEPYDKTLYRLWDWGETRIVPPEIYELIKDY